MRETRFPMVGAVRRYLGLDFSDFLLRIDPKSLSFLSLPRFKRAVSAEPTRLAALSVAATESSLVQGTSHTAAPADDTLPLGLAALLAPPVLV